MLYSFILISSVFVLIVKMSEGVKVPFKYCLVPCCTSTTIKTPEKLFFCVPNDKAKRKAWTIAMKRDERKNPALSTKTTLRCCEDHFSLEEDMENYWQWRLTGNVKRLKLKVGVVPHRFECQKKTILPQTQRKRAATRKRIALVKEALSAAAIPLGETSTSLSPHCRRREVWASSAVEAAAQVKSADNLPGDGGGVSTSNIEAQKGSIISSELDDEEPIVKEEPLSSDSELDQTSNLSSGARSFSDDGDGGGGGNSESEDKEDIDDWIHPPKGSKQDSSLEEIDKNFVRRIVDIHYVFKQLQNISKHKDNLCTLTDMKLVHEERNGFISTFTFQCTKCHIKGSVCSDDPSNTSVNDDAVMAMNTICGSHAILSDITNHLKVPEMQFGVYSKIKLNESEREVAITAESRSENQPLQVSRTSVRKRKELLSDSENEPVLPKKTLKTHGKFGGKSLAASEQGMKSLALSEQGLRDKPKAIAPKIVAVSSPLPVGSISALNPAIRRVGVPQLIQGPLPMVRANNPTSLCYNSHPGNQVVISGVPTNLGASGLMFMTLNAPIQRLQTPVQSAGPPLKNQSILLVQRRLPEAGVTHTQANQPVQIKIAPQPVQTVSIKQEKPDDAISSTSSGQGTSESLGQLPIVIKQEAEEYFSIESPVHVDVFDSESDSNLVFQSDSNLEIKDELTIEDNPVGDCTYDTNER